MTLTRALETATAIRRLDTTRDDLFAVDISGEVTSSDVENLYGLLEGAYELHQRIDVLARATDLQQIDWQGVSEETIEEGRRHGEAHVGRCAIVGGPDWTTHLGGFFSPQPKVDLRYFPADRENEAWEWLGATEIRDFD